MTRSAPNGFSGRAAVRQFRHLLTRFLPYLTGFWIALLLVQPAGLIRAFFWGDVSAAGIDYWCIPRGFLNVLAGHSAYDTFAGSQFGGPVATWYLGHPVFEFLVAPWFAFLTPASSLQAWSATSVALLLLTGWLFSRRAASPLARAACMFLCVFGFPALSLLFTGNMHTWLVLALGLTILGLFDMAHPQARRSGRGLLAAGLLLSLFSKPIVLFMLPMLLIVRETRSVALATIAVYAAVSAACVLLPALNPEGIGLQREFALLLDPAYVREHMNIYKNQFVVTAEMKDNAIHWLNLIAQSDFYWNHIQIFSLSAFINSLVGTEVPAVLYKLPLVAALASSITAAWIADRPRRLVAAAWCVMLLSLTFFLSYNTVWEYQYTAVIPLLLFAVVLLDRNVDAGLSRVLFACAVIIALPSLYFVFGDRVSTGDLGWLRSTRIVPVCIMFAAILWTLWREYLPGPIRRRDTQLPDALAQ